MKNQKLIFSFLFAIIVFFSLGLYVGVYETFPYEFLRDFKNEFDNNDIPIMTSYVENVEPLIRINTIDEMNSTKNDLIFFLWKQNELPSSNPSIIEKNISDSRYSTLENLQSIDKQIVEMEYGINSISYLFQPKKDNGHLIIYVQGHLGDFYEGKSTIQYFLNKNYSVLAFSMPLLGMNSSPIIDHPTFGKIKFESHNQFELLEKNDFSPMKFFVEPIIINLNYFEKSKNFESIHMLGISGGGWQTTLTSAIDERIDSSYSIAGSVPIFLRSDSRNFGDYEQHHREFYEIANYLELYMLASHGDNRKFVQIFNENDPCCFAGNSPLIYENIIKNKISNIGEGEFKIIIDNSHNKHMISEYALEKIINEIVVR